MPEPAREMSSVDVVRGGLALLASTHPTIRPDDVAYLADDFLDWDKLVRVDFVSAWTASIADLLARDDDLDRSEGAHGRPDCPGPTHSGGSSWNRGGAQSESS